MSWLLGLIIKYKNFTVLLIVSMVSITFLKQDKNEKLRIARALTMSIFAPVEFVINKSTRAKNIFNENRKLKFLTAKLAMENAYLKEAERENKRLRELLEFKEKSDLFLIPAEIIGRNTDGINRAIIINVGRDEDIQLNMPVVTSHGIVGKVVEVTPKASLVQILNDPNCRVGVIVQRSRIVGILQCVDGLHYTMENVLVHDDVEVGDVVVSSGLGGIFPKGIPVGEIAKLDKKSKSLFAKIEVKLNVDFGHLEEVFIVKKTIDWHSYSEQENELIEKALKDIEQENVAQED